MSGIHLLLGDPWGTPTQFPYNAQNVVRGYRTSGAVAIAAGAAQSATAASGSSTAQDLYSTPGCDQHGISRARPRRNGAAQVAEP
jgi:hypothetical protein